MAELQWGESCGVVINSVVGAQYINLTDTQTATSPWQLPRQRTASGGKNGAIDWSGISVPILNRQRITNQ